MEWSLPISDVGYLLFILYEFVIRYEGSRLQTKNTIKLETENLSE